MHLGNEPPGSLRAHRATSPIAALASGRTVRNCQQHCRPGQDRFRGPPGGGNTYGSTHVSPRLPESGSRPNPAIVREREVGLIRMASHRHRLQHASLWPGARPEPQTSTQRSHPGTRPGTSLTGAPGRGARTLFLAATGASLTGGRRHQSRRIDPSQGTEGTIYPKAASGRNSPAALGSLGRLTGGEFESPTWPYPDLSSYSKVRLR
jgi:hypothetical protein